MKKKISVFLLIVLIVNLMLGLLIPTKAFAKQIENSYFKVDIPNSFQKLDEATKDNKYAVSYYKDDQDSPVGIDIYVQENKDLDITEDDLNDILTTITDSLGKDLKKVYEHKIITLNNIKGFKIVYTYTTDGQQSEIMQEYIGLVTDNRQYEIMITSLPEYRGTSEEKAIINSFKVKDTVKNTNGIPFTDVKSSDWYYDAVKYSYEKGLIKGTNAYTFNPSGKLSRSQLVVMLWRMEGTPKATANKFTDIKKSDEFYNAVNWAASKEIVNGYANGKFGPYDNITREQLASILMNYARYKKKDVSKRADTSKFTDFNKVESYFRNAVSWCVANKIISGKSNGTKIDPKGTATRAETAAMLRTYCLNIK